MNEKLKNLINELSEKLMKVSYLYLFEISGDEENIGDLIDFIVSTHLTSAFELMENVAKGNKEIELKVNQFTTQLINFIENLSMINNVQVITNH